VKCDEEKPGCTRCLNFGVECGGYQPIRPNQLRALLPRRFNQDSVVQQPSIEQFHCQNEMEHRFFQTYQTQTSKELSGFFYSSLWDCLILQAAYSEKFVSDMVIALGAVTTAQVAARQGNEGAITSIKRLGLSKYEEGIRGMKESLEHAGENPRTALIGCLLVCCFEGLLGQRSFAMAHARSGYKLLKDWLGKRTDTKHCRPGMPFPLFEEVEEVLIQAFLRLDTHVMMFLDNRPQELYSDSPTAGSCALDYMPIMFSNIDEARVYHEIIMKRMQHWIRSTVTRWAEDSGQQFDPLSVPTWNGLGHIFQSSPEKQDTDADPMLTSQCRNQKMTQIRERRRWETAFAPLYQAISASQPSLSLAANILLEQSLLAGLTLSHDYTSLNPETLTAFKQIVDLCQVIVEQTEDIRNQHASSFTFDSGIISGLHYAAKWSPDRMLRRQAIDLLLAYSFREGVWDSLMLAELNQHIIDLEDDAIEKGYTLEDSRVRIADLEIDSTSTTTTITLFGGSEKIASTFIWEDDPRSALLCR